MRTEGGAQVSAERVIVATQLPFLDRGLFFARAKAMRSYATSVRLRGAPPPGMYLQAETRVARCARRAGAMRTC